MAKPGFGKKRICLACSTKYYDFNREPITCPSCGALFVTPSVRTVAAGDERRHNARGGPEVTDSLADLDVDVDEGANVLAEADDVELADNIEDDTFLESDPDTESIDTMDIGLIVKEDEV